jgi:hypothetical protein
VGRHFNPLARARKRAPTVKTEVQYGKSPSADEDTFFPAAFATWFTPLQCHESCRDAHHPSEFALFVESE